MKLFVRYVVIVLLCLFEIHPGFSQEKPLLIGNKVPDLQFTMMINHQGDFKKLSDLKGRLILLDFWFSSCTSCLHAFPKLDSIQKKFKEQVQIVLINDFENEAVIKRFYEKWGKRTGYNLSLPSGLSNKKIKELFPHQSDPHYIWIGKDGKIIAITESDQVTEENIHAILNGKDIVLRQKKEIADFDRDKPLFIKGNGGDGANIKFRSILAGYQDGLGSGVVRHDTGNLISRFGVINSAILELYQLAYQCYFPANRIETDAEDREKFLRTGFESYEWKQSNLYCYEVMTIPVKWDSINTIMQQDLLRSFGIRAYKEKRKMKCLVLSGGSVSYKLETNTDPDMNLSLNKNEKHFIQNYPIAVLAESLDQILPLPFINESNFVGNINMDLPDNLLDIDALKETFKKYGFTIDEKEKDAEIFVLTKK